MFDEKIIINGIRKACDKDTKAYKITEYYLALTSGSLDDGGINLATSRILSIEEELRQWVKKHPNNRTNIMQSEESALCLIDDLRKKNLLN